MKGPHFVTVQSSASHVAVTPEKWALQFTFTFSTHTYIHTHTLYIHLVHSLRGETLYGLCLMSGWRLACF